MAFGKAMVGRKAEAKKGQRQRVLPCVKNLFNELMLISQ
jgi:hypothetical protein